MSMRSAKGQGIIAEVFLFSMAIMMAFFIFLFMAATGNTVDQTVHTEIDYTIEGVNKNSVIAVTMDDHLWRSSSISKGDYSGITAKKLISYYFSTPSGDIYVGNESFDRSTVRSDLRDYLEFKMDKYFRSGGSTFEYNLTINDPSQSSMMDVSTFKPSSGSKTVLKIPLKDGDSAVLTLWTRKPDRVTGPGDTSSGPGPGDVTL